MVSDSCQKIVKIRPFRYGNNGGGFAPVLLKGVKIRPFRYGNRTIKEKRLIGIGLVLKSDRFGMEM